MTLGEFFFSVCMVLGLGLFFYTSYRIDLYVFAQKVTIAQKAGIGITIK